MRYAIILLAPLLALLALACKGEGGPASTPTAAPATPTPTATETPVVGAPAEVQAIVDAALSGDPEELRALVGYTKVGCITTPQGIGQPPLCREGEAEGTPVDVLWVAACEGGHVRADEIDDTLSMLSGLGFYAVYRWPEAFDQPPVAAEYAAIFSRTSPQGEALAVQLLIEDRRLVAVKFGCGETPEQLVEFEQLEDVVLPPQP
jgi:hypothetical protein